MARTFRYFLLNAKTNLGAIVSFAAIVAVGAILTGAPEKGLTDSLFGTYFSNFPLMSLMILFLLSYALCTSSLNIALSFGARRRDYFWALQANVALNAAAVTVLNAVMAAIPGWMNWPQPQRWERIMSLGGQSAVMLFLLLLCMQVIGSMCGMLQVKSKALGLAVMIVFVILGATSVVLLLLDANYENGLWGGLSLIFGIVIAAGAAVSEAVMWRTIHRYVVR